MNAIATKAMRCSFGSLEDGVQPRQRRSQAKGSSTPSRCRPGTNRASRPRAITSTVMPSVSTPTLASRSLEVAKRWALDSLLLLVALVRLASGCVPTLGERSHPGFRQLPANDDEVVIVAA